MSVIWVAMLRGINVGRAKRIAMSDVRRLLEELGCADVRTHGQSGNAIFSSEQRKAQGLEKKISTRIRSDFGMDVVVMLRTATEFVAAVESNPFVRRGVPLKDLHAAFLSAEPSTAKAAGIEHDAYLPDEFAFGKRVVYLRLPNGTMGSTLPDWDRVLGVRATQRNWNTTTRIRDLVS